MEFPVTIRRAQADDLVAIHALACLSDERLSQEELKTQLFKATSSSLVAELEGELIGFALAEIEKDEYGRLALLAVAPEVRSQGIGTLLLAYLKEATRAQNGAGLELTCEENLLSYFTVNGFYDQGEADPPSLIQMVWVNPYYKE